MIGKQTPSVSSSSKFAPPQPPLSYAYDPKYLNPSSYEPDGFGFEGFFWNRKKKNPVLLSNKYVSQQDPFHFRLAVSEPTIIHDSEKKCI